MLIAPQTSLSQKLRRGTTPSACYLLITPQLPPFSSLRLFSFISSAKQANIPNISIKCQIISPVRDNNRASHIILCDIGLVATPARCLLCLTQNSMLSQKCRRRHDNVSILIASVSPRLNKTTTNTLQI